jgi:hypothetical protein
VRHRSFRARGAVSTLGDDGLGEVDSHACPVDSINVALNVFIQSEVPKKRVLDCGTLRTCANVGIK